MPRSKSVWIEPLDAKEAGFSGVFDALVIARYGDSAILTEKDIAFFEGVGHAQAETYLKKEAQRVIDMIKRHKKVRVWGE